VGAAAASSFHAVGGPTGPGRPAIGAAATGTGAVGHRTDAADNHAAADGTASGQRARPAGSRSAAHRAPRRYGAAWQENRGEAGHVALGGGATLDAWVAATTDTRAAAGRRAVARVAGAAGRAAVARRPGRPGGTRNGRSRATRGHPATGRAPPARSSTNGRGPPAHPAASSRASPARPARWIATGARQAVRAQVGA